MFQDILMHITIVLVALFTSQKYTYEFSVPKYAILTLAISVLFTMLVFKWIKEKKISLYLTPAHVLWIGFAIVSIISSFNVLRDNPYYFRRSFDIGLYVLFNAVLAVYFSTVYKDKRRINSLLFTFLITGLFVSVDALINFYTGYDVFLGKVGSPFERASIKATVGNVIFTANYIDMLLPVALYFILSFDPGFGKINSLWKIVLLKITAAFAFIVGVVAVIVSQTRSEYLAIIIMSILYVVFYFVWVKIGKKKDSAFESLKAEKEIMAKKVENFEKILLVTILTFVVIAVVVYNTPNVFTGKGKVNMTSRFSAMASVSSIDERKLSWFTSLELWEDHKIFGSGIGTYQLLSISKMGEYLEKHPELYYGWNNFKRAHNDYFQVLGETGIAGLLLILGVLTVLVYYFFSIPGKLKDRDEILLFLSLSVAIVGFAIQSFFSFPGHLLPNALAATFFASVAIGPYFTRKSHKEIKGIFGIIIGMLLLIITYSSTYLRWNHFISEVYFKKGNSAYLTYVKVLEELPKANSYITQLRNQLKELENLSGRFEYLKPENWKTLKRQEYQRKGLSFNDVDIENQRLSEINKIRSKILSELNQIEAQRKKLPGIADNYYKLAKENLVKSVSLNHTYGKSYFYLASLVAQNPRISELKVALPERYEQIFRQEFDDYQKVIFPEYKHKWLEKIVPFIKNNPAIISKFDFASMQAVIDSIGLYETSLKTFNERNTYKALAMRYHTLHNFSKQLLSIIPSTNTELINYVKKIAVSSFDSYVDYAKLTIYNMPGGWNRFPDWKNPDLAKASVGEDIYRFFAGMTVKLQPPTLLVVRDFLNWLALQEIKAVKYMNLKGIWGVPDGVLDFLHASAFAYYKAGQFQETIYALQKLKKMYKNSYENAEKNIEKYLTFARKEVEKRKSKLEENLEKILKETGAPSAAINFVTKKFETVVMDIFNSFVNYNFLAIETDYMKKLVNEQFTKWYDTRKAGIWSSIAVEKMNQFIKELQKMGFPTSTLLEIKNALKSIIYPTPNINVYERYKRFVAHYQLILNDLNYMAKNLKSTYQEMTDNMWEGVIKDWSEIVMEDGTPLNNKEDILNYLDKIVSNK
ncbi:O-antigen ligase family protein [Thermosipho ferrireducens]|uniref:O-antigen ligase family protein n=1 Tax=Thermosipho ferrireducens TaxID=2571116 RepID=A0ABX7SAG5_9BACT|nr:O-antigen ligase [Thermosipho ferrireducens]QTA38905.1 O-antigen ligase family protein [Thermosipho ferrireducens]